MAQEPETVAELRIADCVARIQIRRNRYWIEIVHPVSGKHIEMDTETERMAYDMCKVWEYGYSFGKKVWDA